MTPQQIFDTVAQHIFTQGRKAQNPANGNCMYRSGELKCAVGCLIPDEDYKPEFEKTMLLPVLKSLEEKHSYLYENRSLLRTLQRTHDEGLWACDDTYDFGAWTSTEKMKANLSQVADLYGLDKTALSAMKFSDR